MSEVIKCSACGQPCDRHASGCTALRQEVLQVLRSQEAEVDRLEQLAIERHNAMRVKHA